jgi:hypothetical protein
MPALTRLRGLLAAVLLLAATVGLPLALAATVGDPLHAWPSLHSGQLSDTNMIAILASVFWLAWFSFAVPVATEIALNIATRLGHRPRRQVRLPLLGTQQQLARQLISAVLVLVPTTSSVAASTPATHQQPTQVTSTAWSDPMLAHSHQAQGNHSAAHGRGERTYVIPEVGGMRSYWALAEHYLDDGARWREIWQLNQGRVHTDGTVMDTPRQLHTGWTILIPIAADHRTGDPASAQHGAGDVTVRAGDTLSGIAAENGIPGWRGAWARNADRREPDGQRFTEPDLIYPGWTITLPDSPAEPSDPPSPANGHPNSHFPTTRTGHQPASTPKRHSPEHNGGTPGPAMSVTPTTPTETERPNSPPVSATAPAESEHPARHRLPVVPLEMGLAAAAAVAALDRARRIAQRRRRYGRRTPPPPAPLRQVEADLRHAARVTHPAVAAVELAAALTTTAPVTIRTVIARDSGAIDLHLDVATAHPPPPPFVQIPQGWQLPADATGFTFAVDAVDEPTPTLVAVGRLADGDVLVDLAHAGPVSIAGDQQIITAYLTQLAAALVAAPWSGRVQVHVPANLSDQLDHYEQVTADPGAPALPAPWPPVPTGEEEPGWCTSPIYLYLGWTDTDDVEALLRAAADPTIAVHAVLIGGCETTTVWTLDGETLTIPGMNEPLTVTVPDPDAPTAVDLIAFTATATDLPVGDPQLPTSAADAPPDRRTTSRQLNLLGPVELAGLITPRRTQTLNLLTYLALHRHGADHDTLATILWPKRVSGKTLRNRITEARALVDGAITEGPTWRLTDEVTTDWQRFTALADGTPDEQHEALRLVRGRPFHGLDYADWIDLEGIRSEVEATIVDLALTVAQRDLDTGEPDAAFRATRAGLAASRYEERLHRLGILAAHTAGHTAVIDSLKNEMRTALDIDIEPDDTLQPETLQLYADLRRTRGAISKG